MLRDHLDSLARSLRPLVLSLLCMQVGPYQVVLELATLLLVLSHVVVVLLVDLLGCQVLLVRVAVTVAA